MDADAARRALVEDNLDLVHRIANQMRERICPQADMDDLVSMGSTGLLEAAERYDSGRSTPFRTFAYYRIRGAIYDGVRRMGRIPRRSYRLLRAARQADAYLEELARERGPLADTGGHAPDAQRPSTAERLHDLYRALSGVTAVFCVSLDAALEDGDQIACPQDTPDRMLRRARLRRWLAEAVHTLPARERDMIEKCYFEDKTLVQAGEELGLSRSWASRLHARAVDRLRRTLRERGVEHADDG